MLLNKIAKLEKNQEILTNLPDSCQQALDHLRIIAAPRLGKEGRILEAIEYLCKIPADSEMHLKAKIWIKHWHNSPNWGEKTQLYLENFDEYNDSQCPAANF